MNLLKSTTELKAESRELLLGKYGPFIAVLLLLELITGVITLIISAVTGTSFFGQIISLILTLLAEFFCAILITGMNYFSLNMGLNRTYGVQDLFYGFRYKTDKILILQGILFLMDLVCLLPAILLAVLFYLLLPTAPAFAPVLITLAAVVGGFVMIYLNLRYHFILYIVLDYPNAGVRDIFRFSAVLMNGRCLRLFYLYVTFIPYYLLALLSLGLGLLFVTPYMKMTITKFYIDLIDCHYRKISND